MYKYLIEDETDLKVTLKPNMGKTSFLFNALQKGDIDIYPEFTGTVLETFLNEPSKSHDENQVYQQAKTGLDKQFKMAYLDPMKYNNTYALAVSQNYAKEHQLSSISDLQAVSHTANVGFTLEFADRNDGYKGIQKLYGITFDRLQTMEPKLRYSAIEAGDIQVIDGYSTDSELAQYKLTVLKDDRQLFPPYQGAPLLLNSTLEKYPELAAILNKLGGKITDDEMRKMNYEVNINNQSAATVAKEFLQKKDCWSNE